jgi:RND superfamily putative drug exporter
MFATVARFCVTRRRWVLAAWMLLLIIGLAAVIPLFGRLKTANGATGSESARGAAIVDKATTMGPTAVVLVKGPPVNAPATRAAVQALTPSWTGYPT